MTSSTSVRDGNDVSVLEELRTLRRLFPRATELAVSPEMVERFEHEIVAIMRFASLDEATALTFPVEHLPGLTVQRLPLLFRDVRLTRVVPA
jgi:hypothetical protein